MDIFTPAFLEKVAAGVAGKIAGSTGLWAREKLAGDTEQKALKRCAREGLGALLREGVPEEARDRQHVADVVATFFGYDAPARVLVKVLRGRPLEARELVELFEEECEPETLEELLPKAGFTAFLEAFELQADAEEALTQALERGMQRRQADAAEEGAAQQGRMAKALEGLPEAAAERRQAEKAARLDAARRHYLTRARQQWRRLPLAELGGKPEEEMTLDQVYIDLDTTTEDQEAGENEGLEFLRRPTERPQVSAREAVARDKRLVLLGAPGAGKSTFVRELLARIAGAQLGDGEAPGGLEVEGLVPVLLELRRTAARLSELTLESRSAKEREEALAGALLDEALAELERASLRAEAFRTQLAAAWVDGQVFLVLDGLDEVARGLRPRVREAVAAALGCHRFEHVIVTCRVRSYSGSAELGLPSYTLAPLDEEKIVHFSRSWYRGRAALGLDDAKASSRGEDLAEKALFPEHRELAENPMLLTTMALVHEEDVGLPRERVRLYDRAVKVLWDRQSHKVGRDKLTLSGSLDPLLADWPRMRQTLERLAFEAHTAGTPADETDLRGLTRERALGILEEKPYLGDPGAAGEFLDYVDQRSGLLVGHGGSDGRPELYSFPHRTFQEYLAGRYLIALGEPAEVYWERAAEGDLWSVAAELGAETLLYLDGKPNFARKLAYDLCPDEVDDERSERAVLWSAKAAALLGIADLEEDTEGPQKKGPTYLAKLLPRLTALLPSGLPPQERCEAGRVLAELGDFPREATTVERMELCRVPKGEFEWGGGLDYLEDETTPEERLSIPYAYWISRFPVTQGQYAEFAEAGGYREERYWTEAREAGVWEPGEVTDFAGDTSFDGPEEYGTPFGAVNHPVVGVTWYEALAYTRWLTERLRNEGLPDGWEVRLPSEREWEKATRGGLDLPIRDVAPRGLADLLPSIATQEDEHPSETNPTPRRIYPWGDDEPTPERVNYQDTAVASTSAVGCFPDGASPYGCEEMAGNVWEWCRDVRRGEPTDRGAVVALRGGSWGSPALFLAAAFRFWFDARFRNRVIGFRVVLSSVSEHG